MTDPTPVALPPTVQVIVRDWLSANHVLFEDRAGHVLIDTGYGARVDETFARLRAAGALGERPLARIVNTHPHSDHVGGNAALARACGCRITIPEGEAAIVSAWDRRALLLDYADQRCERFAFDDTIAPGDVLDLGGIDWQVVAAPGHDMGAVMLYAPAERVLITGDALWRNGFGFVAPEAHGSAFLDAAEATLAAIARLDVRLVIPGHGEPFGEVAAALDRSFSRVEQFRREPERMAWYGVKACFVFALLDRGRLPLAGLAEYLDRVAMFADWNRSFLRLPAADLARQLVAELGRAGAVRIDAGMLLPGAGRAG